MIRRELLVFLIVGSLTVLVDFLSYRALLWTDLLETGAAKAAGFLIGTLFAYFANRAFTFGGRPHQRGSAWRFAALYICTLAVNVSVNGWVLGALYTHAWKVQAAFLVATGVSTCMNFLGMKLFVFKTAGQTELT